MGGWVYKWGDMNRQAMAKVSDDGQSVVGLGTKRDGGWCCPWLDNYVNPISIQVSGATGIAHCIFTNVGGSAIAYWNFDGTNFGETYRMYFMDANNDIPGKSVPSKYRRNATDGADLTINSDGMEVTIAGLHKGCNIWLHKGLYAGQLWDDDFFVGIDNSTVIGLFDTTGTGEAANIPETEPKPHTDLQVIYDENDKLAVAYVATYISRHADTSRLFGDWTFNHTSVCGDTNGTFYDGSEHPKQQIRFWSEVTGTHTTIAESMYPLPGQTLKFWEDGIIDSGRAFWGQGINDGLISHFNLTSNMDAQEGEPKLVLAFQQCTSEPELVSSGYEEWGEEYMRYYQYYSDLFVAVSMDGTTWQEPVNITNTPNKDEVDLSINRDVIDNKLHMIYFRDSKAGRDDWLSGADTTQKEWVMYSNNGIWGIPIRKDPNDQVEIIYKVIDLSTIVGVEKTTNIPNNFELSQNYPNPFNPTTTIKYSIPVADANFASITNNLVILKVYDILGREVATLVNKEQQPGNYEVSFNGANLSSGTYYYKLKCGNFVESKKMILLK